MIQTLFTFLPKHLNTLAMVAAVVGALVGVGMWLTGSRYSRTLVSMLALSLGLLVGLQLPRWFGWGMSGWATGVLGAVVCGALAHTYHQACVGMGLGMTLALWASIATLAICGFGNAPDGSQWVMPVAKNTKEWVFDFWNSLALQTRKVLPIACAASLAAGVVACLKWPRFGTILMYSTLGVTMLLAMGCAAVLSTRPDWLKVVPNQLPSQMVVLAALVAFGVVFQWKSVPVMYQQTRSRLVEEDEDDDTRSFRF
jgi:hypothetical protein